MSRKGRDVKKMEVLENRDAVSESVGERRGELWDALEAAGLAKLFDTLVSHGWDDLAAFGHMKEEHRAEMSIGLGFWQRLQALRSIRAEQNSLT